MSGYKISVPCAVVKRAVKGTKDSDSLVIQLEPLPVAHENLRRKTVLLNRIQELLDAHYAWENENGIDDDEETKG